jgi:hypothetical protein
MHLTVYFFLLITNLKKMITSLFSYEAISASLSGYSYLMGSAEDMCLVTSLSNMGM